MCTIPGYADVVVSLGKKRSVTSVADIEALITEIANILEISNDDIHSQHWPFLSDEHKGEYIVRIKDAAANRLLTQKNPHVISVMIGDDFFDCSQNTAHVPRGPAP